MLVLVSVLGPGVTSGCRRRLPDAEIRLQADALLSIFTGSLKIDERETIFTVQSLVENGKITLTGQTNDRSLKQSLVEKMATIQGVDVVDQVAVLPASSLGERNWGIVKVPVADLGDEPGKAGGAHTVTQARMGDALRLLEQRSGWYWAQMEDNYLGWADPSQLFVTDKAGLDAFLSGKLALVVGKLAEPLDAPDGKAAMGKLPQGSVLPIAGSEQIFLSAAYFQIRRPFCTARTSFRAPKYIRLPAPTAAPVMMS